MSIQCNASMGVRGKYRAIVHTGHTYDEDGNVLTRGEILRETPFGKNLITNLGIDVWLGRSISGLRYMICGPSNVPPVAGDTVMGDAYGYASQTAGSVEISSNVDPALGVLYRTFQHTRTFPPGSFGGSSVNVSKAGIVQCDGTTLTHLRTGALLSAGLLVDSLGNPTTISVNPTEFLDIVWEVTIFVPFDVSSTVSITVDGVPTNYTYTVRPQGLWFTSNSPSYNYWVSVTSSVTSFYPVFAELNYIFTGNNVSGVANASLVTANSAVSGFPSNMSFTSVSAAAYVNGSAQRTFTAVLSPSQGNPSPTITKMGVALGAPSTGYWQIAFSPGLPKTAAKQLSIDFTFSLANV